MDILSYPGVLVFAFGLVAGSFLNVCIYRLPRGLSVVRPPSACPLCEARIRPWENIPVLSYILLRGKCRHCGELISLRYPVVELLNAALYLLVFGYFGPGWHLPFILAFSSAMIVITFIDLDFQIIPDVITLPGVAVGLLGASFFIPDPFSSIKPFELFKRFELFEPFVAVGFWNSLIGLLLGGGLFYLIAVLSRGGMGGGDIKMMAMVGAFMGWKAVLLTTFLGSLAGSAVGIFLMVAHGKGRKTKIPFGPFLALGALITLFLGSDILRWYFHL